jgi:hypothetical protein
MGEPEPSEVPLSGPRRWSPAIWGACLSVVTCLPVLLLALEASSSDGWRERIALFCLFPTVLTVALHCPDVLVLGLVGAQFLLYGIILSLPTRARERRRARLVLLGIHLAMVAMLFWVGGGIRR